MGTYNIHAGHAPSNSGGSNGAVGILNESDEARKVKNKVIELLRSEGHTVYDCTCDQGLSQNGVLNYIVARCNAHAVDLDVSLHLDAGRNDGSGDGSTGGCEVLVYDNKTDEVGARINANISSALGIRNRGLKDGSGLYVIRNTNSPAILVECAFVDDMDDAVRWNVNQCATAIVNGILSSHIIPNATVVQPSYSPPVSSNKKVDVFYNVYTNKWLGQVTNLSDYAGWKDVPIRNVAIGVSVGSVKYRVHIKGGSWLPYVTGYNIHDGNNGYGGNGQEIDAIEVIYYTPDSIRPYKYAKYRVAPCYSNYYSWQLDNNKGNGQDGYAGSFGKSISKFQISID